MDRASSDTDSADTDGAPDFVSSSDSDSDDDAPAAPQTQVRRRRGGRGVACARRVLRLTPTPRRLPPTSLAAADAGVAAVVVEAGAVGVERGREAPLPHRRRPGSRSPLAPTAALRGRLSLEARLARPQTSAYWRILRAQLSSLGCCFRTSS